MANGDHDTPPAGGSVSADHQRRPGSGAVKTVASLRRRFHETEKPLRRSALPPGDLLPRERASRDWKLRLKAMVPIVEWLPKYGKDCSLYKSGRAPELSDSDAVWDGLRRDAVAGIVIGIMLVPQGMAYGMLAGLPPIYGLYSSIWVLVTYMVFGSCKYLGPGVNAPISLLVADALDAVLQLKTGCSDDPTSEDCETFISASLVVCLMCAVLYAAMAVFRLGAVTSLMPEPALSGFTTGAAMIIITSNMKYFIGTEVPRGGVVETWVHIFTHLDEINYVAVIIGVVSLVMLLKLKEVNGSEWLKSRSKIPIPEQLVVLVLSTVVAFAFDLEKVADLPVVGAIPSGLYAPRFPTTDGDTFAALVSPAVTISLVTYILSINVGKAIASKYDIKVDANQELVALSTESFVGALTGSCVPSGSFSRTALIASLEAESALHNVFTAAFVIVVCIFLTGPLYDLPKVSSLFFARGDGAAKQKEAETEMKKALNQLLRCVPGPYQTPV